MRRGRICDSQAAADISYPWSCLTICSAPSTPNNRVPEATCCQRHKKRMKSALLTGSISAQIGNLPNLTELYLDGNQLTGSIPTFFGSLTNLTKLHLSDNLLTGELPPDLGNMTSLTELYLDGNQLTGSIPSVFGTLANLHDGSFQYNNLTGCVPLSLNVSFVNPQGSISSPYDLSPCMP